MVPFQRRIRKVNRVPAVTCDGSRSMRHHTGALWSGL